VNFWSNVIYKGRLSHCYKLCILEVADETYNWCVFQATVIVHDFCHVQISLVPFGLHNVHLPSAESQQEAYKMARQLPAGVVSLRQWCYGELEFDAMMRQLDNAVSVSVSLLLNSLIVGHYDAQVYC